MEIISFYAVINIPTYIHIYCELDLLCNWSPYFFLKETFSTWPICTDEAIHYRFPGPGEVLNIGRDVLSIVIVFPWYPSIVAPDRSNMSAQFPVSSSLACSSRKVWTKQSQLSMIREHSLFMTRGLEELTRKVVFPAGLNFWASSATFDSFSPHPKNAVAFHFRGAGGFTKNGHCFPFSSDIELYLWSCVFLFSLFFSYVSPAAAEDF